MIENIIIKTGEASLFTGKANSNIETAIYKEAVCFEHGTGNLPLQVQHL